MNNKREERIFEVHHYSSCNGWINSWYVTDENGKEVPEQFTSLEEAQAEIDRFLSDINTEITLEEREEDEAFSEDEFCIYDARNKIYI